MCKAILAFVLLLELVPSPVLAQGTSANGSVDLPRESAMPSTRAARSSLPTALQGGPELSERGNLWVPSRFGSLRSRSTGGDSLAQQPALQNRGWIGRHPGLFGALVGAGAGMAFSNATDNEWFCSGSDDDCLFYTRRSRTLVGAGMGAGVGALVGWLAGRVTR